MLLVLIRWWGWSDDGDGHGDGNHHGDGGHASSGGCGGGGGEHHDDDDDHVMWVSGLGVL